MRPFTAAVVQLAPQPGPLCAATVQANCAAAAGWVERCVAATGAELVVLPETSSTGFLTGLPAEELWAAVSPVPGPVTDPIADVAARLGVYVVWGSYERGPTPGVLYNTAAMFGPEGALLGRYRKTHPFTGEAHTRGGWVTSGDESCVIETPMGRIGLLICYDGDFPEVARVARLQGAELLARPSALLRPADIWELTNRARAYDNQVYVLGANSTGTDPGGAHYFGNSMIVAPDAEVIARAASHEGWASARIEPAGEALSQGSSVPRGFDHLADRNVEFLRRYADDLARTWPPSAP
jgi:predicted amidohydrolase